MMWKDLAGSEVYKAASSVGGILLNMGAPDPDAGKGNARRTWQSWVTKGSPHPPRTEQKGLAILRFQ